MPRVYTKTKSDRGKHEYRCRACSELIESGQSYYEWKKRQGGPQRRHTACGYPRPSELSNRKTAVVLDAVQDTQSAMGAVTFSLPPEYDIRADEAVDLADVAEELRSLMESIADAAEGVADEYEEGVGNMPEGLQYSPTAEAMNDVAERLREWADELRSWEPDSETEVEVPDPGEFPADADSDDEVDRESQMDALETAVSDAVDALREEASAALDDVPEYEG